MDQRNMKKEIDISVKIKNSNAMEYGTWVQVPITSSKLNEVYEKIGIKEESEILVSRYCILLKNEIDGRGSYHSVDFNFMINEFEGWDKLNYLVGRLTDLSVPDKEKYVKVLDSMKDGKIPMEQKGIDGLINLTYNLEKYKIGILFGNVHDTGREWKKSFDGTLKEMPIASIKEDEKRGQDRIEVAENKKFRESVKDKLGKNKEALDKNAPEKKEPEHSRDEAR